MRDRITEKQNYRMTEFLRTSSYTRLTEKDCVLRTKKKVITSQQFMRAKMNDGLINDMKLDDMRLLLFALFFVGRITLHCMHSLSGTILAVQWGKAKNAGASCSAVRDSEVIRLVLYLR